MASAVNAADFRALGTGVRVIAMEPDLLEVAVEAVQAELDAVDAACSRFRQDSELSRLLEQAGTERAVSAVLFEALAAAVRVAELTDGAVDPTVGAALAALGYDRDFEAVLGDHREVGLGERPAAGWRRIRLDARRRSVTIPAGVVVDLGSSAKALAADRAAAAAHASAGCGVLVNLGGDIAVAGAAPAGGWPVLVTDDHSAPEAAPGQLVALAQGGLATSSTTVRRWIRGRAELHHILDPATGLPARTPWRTASAVAPTCLVANAYATAAIVWGAAAPGRLASRRIPARLVREDGGTVKVAGWPEEGERR
jgi:FAD:protein FMN transferase